MRFIKNADIENIAEQRIAEYEQQFGAVTALPMPIENIIGQVYQLTVLWDTIEETPGETILGALQPQERLIILNTAHLALFEEKPGLERSTIGHEAGHWEFHIDKGCLSHPRLFEHQSLISHRRHSGKGKVEIFSGEGCASLFLDAVRRKDTPDQERVANRFAAALSMPKRLVKMASHNLNLLHWHDLYLLADRFVVNISALTVRLQQLGLIYIDEHKQLHRSIEEAKGQQRLF